MLDTTKPSHCPVTFAHFAGHSLRFNSDILAKRIAIKTTSTDLTYEQLGDAVHRIYGFMKLNGIGSQDVISFYLHECWQHAALELATVIAGAAVFGRGFNAINPFRDFGCSIVVVAEKHLEMVLEKIDHWANLKMIVVIESELSNDMLDERKSGVRCVSLGAILQCLPIYDDYEDWNDRDAEELVFLVPSPRSGRPKRMQSSVQEVLSSITRQYMYNCDWNTQIDVLPIPTSLSTPAGFFRFMNAVAMGATALLGPFRTLSPLDRSNA